MALAIHRDLIPVVEIAIGIASRARKRVCNSKRGCNLGLDVEFVSGDRIRTKLPDLIPAADNEAVRIGIVGDPMGRKQAVVRMQWISKGGIDVVDDGGAGGGKARRRHRGEIAQDAKITGSP